MNEQVAAQLTKDFMDALIRFSDGKINRMEAELIAEKRMNPDMFDIDQPYEHKSPGWLAKTIVREMGLL